MVLMLMSNDIDFGTELHPEAVADRGPDGIGQGHYLPAVGTSEIDQHQSLPGPDPCPSERTALPPALLYEPAGGELDRTGIAPYLIERNCGPLPLQLRELVA